MANANVNENSLVMPVVFPYLLLHLLCLGALVTGIDRQSAVLFAVSYVVKMLGVGVAYHKYFSHRSFAASRPWQFILGVWGVLSCQKGPLWWAYHHRLHHRFADSPRDVHSPMHLGRFESHVGWFFRRRYRRTVLAGIADFSRFPELRLLDDWRCYFTINAVAFFVLFWLFGFSGVVWGGSMSTVLCLHTAHSIQSISHGSGGYRRFSTRDHSRNHLWIGYLSMGEWHNNHHHNPGLAKQGVGWWEVDLQFLVVRLMARVGLISNVRHTS